MNYDITFEFITIDYKLNRIVNFTKKYWQSTVGEDYLGRVPEIRLFGCDKYGKTICVHVHGFLPFFYVQLPRDDILNKRDYYATFMQQRIKNDHVKNDDFGRKDYNGDDVKYVYDMKRSMNTPIRGYQQPSKNFIKVTLVRPPSVPSARSVFEEDGYTTHESDIQYTLRYIISERARPNGWSTATNFHARHEHEKEMSCHYEIDIHYKDLTHHSAEEEQDKWKDNAPFKIMSFDIECESRRNIFPTPDKNKVIQIASYIRRFGVDKEKPSRAVIQCLKKTDKVDGVETECYEAEIDLLHSFSRLIQEEDPDFITGYNINNFDFPYLIQRARVLGMHRDPGSFVLGRVKNEFPQFRDTSFANKARGTIESKENKITGRTIFDIYQIVTRDIKLKSYTLNNVAFHFLKEKKEEMPYSLITPLWDKNASSRKRIAEYCLKDALLPDKLNESQFFLLNEIEMARVCWIPVKILVTGGQTIKVKTLLMVAEAAGPNGDGQAPYLIPTKIRAKETSSSTDILSRKVTYKGATVIEPKRGYYSTDEPISTLDFASLYPSIMQTHNLCYSTLLTTNQASELVKDKDYIETPSGSFFALPNLRQGLLPIVLTNLLNSRKEAKKKKRQAEEAGDVRLAAVYNAKQLALKLTANSVYGFTGATTGPLPEIRISASVTAFGREMIETTKHIVESKLKDRYPDVEVIYGDTGDSFFFFLIIIIFF